jgi:hypothetical protein
MARCPACRRSFRVLEDEDDGQHGCPSCGFGDEPAECPFCGDLDCALDGGCRSVVEDEEAPEQGTIKS